MLEHAIYEFHKQMKQDSVRYFEALDQMRSEMPRMKAERRKLEIEAKNVSGAIAQYGIHRSPTLLTQLSLIKNRLETLA
jgi:hypothetical protein